LKPTGLKQSGDLIQYNQDAGLVYFVIETGKKKSIKIRIGDL